MINLGIVGCSEIAFRRFMPAVKNVESIHVAAVAEEYAPEKLDSFCSTWQLEGMRDFKALIDREDLDAIYVPQPPALHYKWASYALEKGKHVLVEKPSTTCLPDTQKLVELARDKGLALHENYMFIYHSQIETIKKIVESGTLGTVYLYRANFGFPMRAQNDFRYNKKLGGGALLDAGGYTARLATILLGDTIRLKGASLRGKEGFEVDMFGSAMFENDEGVICQTAFGMDCKYQCSLEIWGSSAKLITDRIFTAPDGFTPSYVIERQEGSEKFTMEADSTFEQSIRAFANEIGCGQKREEMYRAILLQSGLVEQMKGFSF